MGLEIVQFVSDLNVAWPAPTDKMRFGDDHLRNIKTALKNTFPNLTGAMELTQVQLNTLPAWQEAMVAHLVPTGAILAWSGAEDEIPDGWALCDGANGTPNLRDRFIVGAGTTYEVGDTGGAVEIESEPDEDAPFTVTTESHVLTEAELPSHRHLLFAAGPGSGALTAGNQAFESSNSGGDTEYSIDGTATAATLGRSSAVGSGNGHTHNIEVDPHTHMVATLPPYYALCWIMKTLEWEL